MGMVRKALNLKERVPSTSLVRREGAMVASAERIRLSDRSEADRLRKRQQDWQSLAWSYFDAVGQVKNGALFLGNALARLRLVPAVLDDPGDEPVPLDEHEDFQSDTATSLLVQDTLRRLGTVGGYSEILRRLGVNLTIPGEAVIVGLAARPEMNLAERWEIRSSRELVNLSGRTVLIDGPDSADRIELTDEDYLWRIWNPHVNETWKADSPMRGVLSKAEELLILDRMARSVERSRNNAGLLLLPTELDFRGPAVPTTDTGAIESASSIEKARADFFEDLLRSLSTPVQDEGSASAIVPHIIYGASEALKEVRTVDLSRALDEWIDKRTERVVLQFAQGFGLPVETLIGHASTTFSNARQIDQDKFKDYIEPLAILACSGLTSAYFHPMLQAAGIEDFQRFCIWFDPARLVARPNRGQDGKDLYDRYAISARALRDSTDYTEEDAPDPEEIAMRLEFEQAKTARRWGPGTDEPSGDDTPSPEPVDKEEEAVTAAVEEPAQSPTPNVLQASPIGRALLEIDRDLRSRLSARVDAAMLRTLERAGARLVNRVRGSKDSQLKQLIKGVPHEEVAATLGRSIVAQMGLNVDQLLEGSFAELAKPFARHVGRAQLQVLELVPGLEEPAYSEAAMVMASYREEAWTWLQETLTDLSRDVLFDPAPKAPELGEFDASVSVQAGVIREAMARAGGSQHAPVTAAGAEIVPISVVLSRALGLAAGWFARDLMASHGVVTDQFVWRYGPYHRERPFEPHVELDGVTFSNFDDEVLRVDGDFPETEFYAPGDHDFCICDVELVITEAEASQVSLLESIAASANHPRTKEPV